MKIAFISHIFDLILQITRVCFSFNAKFNFLKSLPYHSNSDCTPISVVAVFMCFGIDISRYKIEMNNADLKNSGA